MRMEIPKFRRSETEGTIANEADDSMNNTQALERSYIRGDSENSNSRIISPDKHMFTSPSKSS